ncbi:MlaC/ttg2D family ABC transporter substrate-binding protein [Campylobacter sp. MIT 97-5078]|uniref:MlaC/ttg2D family ABC transporter substrate-binding protein n=1 Tax=Campylobacter sp. MIT 97-5078 TaxID=1548153 RepID=UPI000513A9A3|nr:ABC transporter substrate-binding protein [Campylobacter sp. MIT 97-5078]KGI55730.1 toluene tolerance protein [Campylobacter sp. MIT 97-5078]TQR27165.1 toluene tolerance protein [Campylobacter sp. MIT 97-5078]
MKKILCILCLSVFYAFALKLESLPQIMQENIDKSLVLLQNAAKDKSKAADGIFKLFDPIFDYKLMAKLSLSKNYDKLSASQKAEFDTAFEAQLKASFTSKLSLYTNERIEVKKLEQKNDTRVWLHSVMVIDGEAKNIIFKFYKAKNDEWLIYDVDVLGISIIQTYRSQFADLFEKEGFQSLLVKLKTIDFEGK